MLLVILLIRAVAIFLMGAMPQDSYYYFYASHPSLSYFDHPPAIAWLIKIFTTIFGANSVAIKLGDSFVTIITCWAVYRLALRFYPAAESKKVVLIFLSTLMVSILSLVSTPDTPLMLFWTISLYHLYDAIFIGRERSWIYAGVFMGLAFDSKYTAVFLPAGMILFLMVSANKRKLLFSFRPWLSIIVMAIVSAPVIIWNYENHFASFAFQGAKRIQAVGALQITPKYFFGLLGHQLALLGPILFGSLFYTIYLSIKKYKITPKKITSKQLFLFSFFLPIFFGFIGLSFVYWIKINWMMPAYVTGILLAANVLSIRCIRLSMIFSLVVHLALLTELIYYPVLIKSDDTWLGWRQLSKKVKMLKIKHKADFVFSADSYKTSAELNLYSNEFTYGQNVIGEQALHFSFIGTDLSKLNGRCAMYVDSDPNFKNLDMQQGIPERLNPYFQFVEQLPPIIIYKDRTPVRKFFVYLCHDYRSSKFKLDKYIRPLKCYSKPIH